MHISHTLAEKSGTVITLKVETLQTRVGKG